VLNLPPKWFNIWLLNPSTSPRSTSLLLINNPPSSPSTSLSGGSWPSQVGDELSLAEHKIEGKRREKQKERRRKKKRNLIEENFGRRKRFLGFFSLGTVRVGNFLGWIITLERIKKVRCFEKFYLFNRTLKGSQPKHSSTIPPYSHLWFIFFFEGKFLGILKALHLHFK